MENRSGAGISQFHDELWENKVKRIRLAVMDLWNPVRTATREQAPQAAMLSDRSAPVPPE